MLMTGPQRTFALSVSVRWGEFAILPPALPIFLTGVASALLAVLLISRKNQLAWSRTPETARNTDPTDHPCSINSSIDKQMESARHSDIFAKARAIAEYISDLNNFVLSSLRDNGGEKAEKDEHYGARRLIVNNMPFQRLLLA